MSKKTEPSTSGVRIKRLVLGEPVHAHSEDIDVDFVDMIGINIGGRQSPSMLDIDLVADISLGSLPFRIANRSYELSLRCVRIILEKENATVQPQTFYKMILQSGHVEATDTETLLYNRSADGSTAAGGDLIAGIKSCIPMLTATAFGKISASAKAGRAIEAKIVNKSVYTRELVYHAGQETWVAGGPNGDLRRKTGDLRGEVIGSESDEIVPLCGLEAIDPTLPVSGRLRVRVSVEGFVINGESKDEDVIDKLFESLKKDELYALRRRVKAERDLRRRVAALAMVKNNRRPRASDLDLATRSFVFEPDVEATSEGK